MKINSRPLPFNVIMFVKTLIALASFATLSIAQGSASYTDSGITFQGLQEPTHGVTYGFVLPEDTNSTEFIGEIIAPVANQWIGIALGGQMANDLLIVSWPNGNDIVFSPRYTT